MHSKGVLLRKFLPKGLDYHLNLWVDEETHDTSMMLDVKLIVDQMAKESEKTVAEVR